MAIFFFLTCCFITGAVSLSINYTLRTSNFKFDSDRASLYPVLVDNLTILGNEHFSLSFENIPGQKGGYKFGTFMRVEKASPQIIWDSGPILVTEESRIELNSSGVIVLKNPKGEDIWSAGPNVNRYEMQQDGNLKFYDANDTVVWQSMDYPTDVLLMGQNFTRLEAGNATAMFEGGSLVIKRSPAEPKCKIWDTAVKGQLSYDYENLLYIEGFNESGFLVDFGSRRIYEGKYVDSNSFIRLHQDGYFMVYTLHKGMWNRQPVCCFTLDSSAATFNKCRPKGWKIILVGCLLLGLALTMLCLECLWIFTKIFRRRSLLLTIIICSMASTPLVFVSLLYSWIIYASKYTYDFSYYVDVGIDTREITKPEAATFAIDLAILQTSIVFLLKFLASSPHSLKLITTLILLHMLGILFSYITIVPPLLSTQHIIPNISSVSWWISFATYSLAAINTICLMVSRLPGRRYCNRIVRICFIVFLNLSTIITLPFILMLLDPGYTKLMLTLTSILILISIWAYYVHYGKSVEAKFQSFTLSMHVFMKLLLWLLLGRRPNDSPDIAMSLSSFTYPELEVVTNNFNKMIGKGGFGGVYEGTMLDGKKVAVKKLESNSQGMQEFKSEIETLGKIHHVNLVELLGFCAEGPYKLLVYEFLPNGSLEKWIFHDDVFLGWANRVKILIGTAQGLAYLHQECDPKILHLDVKPQNILLDEFFNAKVSDFGLCRLMPSGQTSMLISRMMGTFGYLAPEWVNGSISEKNDVYSFGIVMLEVLSGRRSYATLTSQENCPSFLEWVNNSMEKGTLIDSRLSQGDYNQEEGKRLVEIALLCVNEDANMRPSMKKVVRMLEGVEDIINPPRSRNHIIQENDLYSINEEA